MPSISDFIISDKPLETGAASVYPFTSLMAHKLTFTNRFDEEVELFQRDGSKILVPRMLTPLGEVNTMAKPPKVIFPKEPLPRDYQKEMFGEVDSHIKDKISGVYKAPTGWGKTLLGYRAAWAAQTRTLVVTTKEDIFTQWIEGAELFLGLPKERIGVIRQSKCQFIDRDFVVALIQSLSIEDKYPEAMFGAFGLSIWDEVHRLPAPQFSRAIFKDRSPIRMGLSATLTRSDEKEVVFHSHIGPVLAEGEELPSAVPKIMRVKTEWACPRKIKVNKATGEKEIVQLDHEPGRTTQVDKFIAMDDARNALIAELTKAAVSKGRKPVIFSSLHIHLEAIEKALLKAGISKMKIGWYVGEGTKEGKEKREKHKERQVLLSTFSMMGEGTSIDDLDTAVLAMPRKDVIQPVGRIRRLLDGKRFPLVIDLVDNDSWVYKRYAFARLKWYRSIEAEVEEWN